MFFDVVFKFFEKVFEGGQGRFGAGLAQTTQGGLGQGLSQLADGIDIFHASFALGNARQNFEQLGGAQTAGSAFAAGL
mgnify:CR=1 FL=1